MINRKYIQNIRLSSSSVDSFFKKPEPTVRTSGKIRVSSVNNVPGFQKVSSDTLVHLAQKDFWKIGQDDEGYFIERLVDDSSGPIKV